MLEYGQRKYFLPLTAEVISCLPNYDKKHKGTPEVMEMCIMLH